MSAWAKPGVKCVCIADDRPWNNEFGEAPLVVPVKDQVLTIQAVVNGGKCLTFVEIPVFQNGGNHAWDVSQFRPLVTRSQDQDVGLFVHHLESTPVGEDA